jgi:hypothetical protein
MSAKKSIRIFIVLSASLFYPCGVATGEIWDLPLLFLSLEVNKKNDNYSKDKPYVIITFFGQISQDIAT